MSQARIKRMLEASASRFDHPMGFGEGLRLGGRKKKGVRHCVEPEMVYSSKLGHKVKRCKRYASGGRKPSKGLRHCASEKLRKSGKKRCSRYEGYPVECASYEVGPSGKKRCASYRRKKLVPSKGKGIMLGGCPPMYGMMPHYPMMPVGMGYKPKRHYASKKAAAARNPWLHFLAQFREENPHLSGRVLMKEASSAYHSM